MIWEGPIFIIFGAAAVIITILIEKIKTNTFLIIENKTNTEEDLTLLKITQNKPRILVALISIL